MKIKIKIEKKRLKVLLIDSPPPTHMHTNTEMFFILPGWEEYHFFHCCLDSMLIFFLRPLSLRARSHCSCVEFQSITGYFSDQCLMTDFLTDFLVHLKVYIFNGQFDMSLLRGLMPLSWLCVSGMLKLCGQQAVGSQKILKLNNKWNNQNIVPMKPLEYYTESGKCVRHLLNPSYCNT